MIPVGSLAATAPKYVAVIDAGSSGTCLTPLADKDDTRVAQAITEAEIKTLGLSSFASPHAAAGPEAIASLLAQLSESCFRKLSVSARYAQP